MLHPEQIERFQQDGFLLLDRHLSEDTLQVLVDELPKLFIQQSEEVFRQAGSQAIRTVFSPEKFSPVYQRLIGFESILGPIQQLAGEEVYLFQSKFNTKVSLARGSWDWHQDWTFWKDDGMPAARAITVAVYLSDVTEFSGPMIVIPGSHQLGTIPVTMENPDGVHSEDLKYVISLDSIRRVTEQCGGMVSTKAVRGSVLIFHSNLLHASAQNLFYENRDLMMFTYNPLSNATVEIEAPRPEYQVKRNFQAVAMEGALLPQV